MGSVAVTTVVVLDLAHCGTTMVAGCLELMGVPMVGREYKPDKWEDQAVVDALRDEAVFAWMVATKPDLWGFKYPGAWKFAPLLKKHLRNPVYFAIYKEPVSVTVRRFGSVNADKLRNTIRQMEDSIDGIIASGLPVRFLSYQNVISAPRAFAARLASLIGISVTKEQMDAIEQYVQPGAGYPSLEDLLGRRNG